MANRLPLAVNEQSQRKRQVPSHRRKNTEKTKAFHRLMAFEERKMRAAALSGEMTGWFAPQLVDRRRKWKANMDGTRGTHPVSLFPCVGSN